MTEVAPLDLRGIPITTFRSTEAEEWRPGPDPGVWIKHLWTSADGKSNLSLVRMDRRTGQVHLHEGEVLAWTLEGRWGYLEYDEVATAGSFVYEPANTVHTINVEEPFVALFHTTGRIIHFDDEGNAIEDPSIGTLPEVLERIRAMSASTP
jgi:hypothetical protein